MGYFLKKKFILRFFLLILVTFGLFNSSFSDNSPSGFTLKPQVAQAAYFYLTVNPPRPTRTDREFVYNIQLHCGPICIAPGLVTWKDNGREIDRSLCRRGLFQDSICTLRYTAQGESHLITATAQVRGSAQLQIVTPTVDQDGQIIESRDDVDCGFSVGCVVRLVMSSIVGMFVELISFVTNRMVIPVMRTILEIMPHTSQFAAPILPVWVVIRNIMNIFFVLILIAIGLLTLFRVPGYNYKQMLIKLVFMIFLINFSLVIGQAILGIADALQSQFLPNNGRVLQKLASTLTSDTYHLLSSRTLNDPNGSTFADIVIMIVYLIFSLGVLAVFAALTVYLVIRVVAMWFLLMLSPIAYGLNVLKFGSNYAKHWWDLFLKYAFFTPLIGLFLTVCAVLADGLARYFPNQARQAFPIASTQDWSQTISDMLVVFTLMGCLWATLEIAKRFAIYGSAQVTSYANKVVTKPTKFVGGELLGYGARAKQRLSTFAAAKKSGEIRGGLGRAAFMALNPITSYKTARAAKEEKRAAVTERFQAAAQQVQDYRTSRTGFDTKAVAKFDEKKMDELRSRYATQTPDKLQGRLEDLRKQGVDTPWSYVRDRTALQKEVIAILTTASAQGKLMAMVKEDPDVKKSMDAKYTAEVEKAKEAARQRNEDPEEAAKKVKMPKHGEIEELQFIDKYTKSASIFPGDNAFAKVNNQLDAQARKAGLARLNRIGFKELKVVRDTQGNVTGVTEESRKDQEEAMVKHLANFDAPQSLQANIRDVRIVDNKGELTGFVKAFRDIFQSPEVSDQQRLRTSDAVKRVAGDKRRRDPDVAYPSEFVDLISQAQIRVNDEKRLREEQKRASSAGGSSSQSQSSPQSNRPTQSSQPQTPSSPQPPNPTQPQNPPAP